MGLLSQGDPPTSDHSEGNGGELACRSTPARRLCSSTRCSAVQTLDGGRYAPISTTPLRRQVEHQGVGGLPGRQENILGLAVLHRSGGHACDHPAKGSRRCHERQDAEEG